MTKRAGMRPTHEQNQADLFGGAPPISTTKAHAARRRPAAIAKATPTPALARAKQSTDNTAADSLLNVRQAAARLGLSKSTLDKMRRAAKGPRFVKTTDRAIRYDPVDLDRWINARRSQSD